MPSNTTKIAYAVAVLKDPHRTPQEMVAAGNAHLPSIKSKAAPGSLVADQAAAWDIAQKDLIQADQDVADADAKAAAARTARAAAMHRWTTHARGCLNAITVESRGSEQAIKAYVCDVGERPGSPLETTPTNFVAVKSTTTGVCGWRWKTHKGNHGYWLQSATNPNAPATYEAPIYVSRGKLNLTDQTPGVLLYGRVAAIDGRLPGGQTAWSAWVAVPVSP